MDWITLRNADSANEYTYHNLKTGEERSLQADGRISHFARSADGRFEYYSVLDKTYTLRDNIARKLRSKYYKQDRRTGEVTELFLSCDLTTHQFGNMILLPDGRFLILVIVEREDNRLYLVDETGAECRELFRSKAYPYGFDLSPDGKILAHHLAWPDPKFNPRGYYAINLSDLEGNRKLVCSEEGHLFFGPKWSPDGTKIVFQDCMPNDDPGHHFADLMICDADGRNLRRLTEGRPLYFGTSHGLPDYRMGGSNVPVWLDDHNVIVAIRSKNAHPDCHFDGTQRDHEELIYDPAQGRGGSHLVRFNVQTFEQTILTEYAEGQWDFHASVGPDNQILFNRYRLGAPTEIWMLDMNTGDSRFISRGRNEHGADYPSFCRFLPDFI